MKKLKNKKEEVDPQQTKTPEESYEDWKISEKSRKDHLKNVWGIDGFQLPVDYD